MPPGLEAVIRPEDEGWEQGQHQGMEKPSPEGDYQLGVQGIQKYFYLWVHRLESQQGPLED
jgi:hypothetical protein